MVGRRDGRGKPFAGPRVRLSPGGSEDGGEARLLQFDCLPQRCFGARVFGSLLLNHRQIVQTHCQVAAVLVDQWCDRSKLPREPDRVAWSDVVMAGKTLGGPESPTLPRRE